MDNPPEGSISRPTNPTGRLKRVRRFNLRARVVSAIAGMTAAADGVLRGKDPEPELRPAEELRQNELRPILKIVRPLKNCPVCKGKADLEWREDGQAVRAGCPRCSFSVEAIVPPETDASRYAEKIKVADLETRQKSAQAEVIENWNLYADGAWDGKSTPGHIKTKIEPDWQAIYAKPESEKPHAR